MTCFRRCLLVALIALLVFLAGGGILVWTAAGWLVHSDSPARADAIVSLSGDPRRHLFAAELYREGYAPQIIITREARGAALEAVDRIGVPFPRMEDVYRDILLNRGVPSHAIRIVGQDLLSTAAEAEALREALPPGASVLVVTSPYHTRRAAIIFADLFGDDRVRVLSSPYETFPKRWWTDQDAARNVLLEIAKIAFYVLGGRFR